MIREPRIYTLTSTLFTYTPLCPSLKIGIGTTADADLRSRDDLVRWFRGPGAEANRREFRAFLTALLPPLARCRNWHADTCAVTWTATGLPYIDHVLDDRIAVAVGGNGKGAKSADDWGWLAARLVAGEIGRAHV